MVSVETYEADAVRIETTSREPVAWRYRYMNTETTGTAWYFTKKKPDGDYPDREVDHKRNMKNLSIRSNNITGVVGVSWDKKQRKWNTRINVDGKTVHLGRYADIKDAIAVREEHSKLHKFNINHGKRQRRT